MFAEELSTYESFWIGLPYVSDFQTLDIDTFERSLKTRNMLVNRVTLMLADARNIFVGPYEPEGADLLENLYEAALRDAEGYNDDPDELFTDDVQVDIDSLWNSNGRIFARHVDPTPVTVLAAIPQFRR
jgi:hypothetical protein